MHLKHLICCCIIKYAANVAAKLVIFKGQTVGRNIWYREAWYGTNVFFFPFFNLNGKVKRISMLKMGVPHFVLLKDVPQLNI